MIWLVKYIEKKNNSLRKNGTDMRNIVTYRDHHMK